MRPMWAGSSDTRCPGPCLVPPRALEQPGMCILSLGWQRGPRGRGRATLWVLDVLWASG